MPSASFFPTIHISINPRDTVKRLVDVFDQNKDRYKSPGYNKTQIRREFIDPFFTALGWDVDNF